MVDSFPQGGGDYEMIVLNIIREQDLPLLHYKIERLERRLMLDFDGRVATWDDEAALMVEVYKLSIRHQVAPVVQLGFGRCTLALEFQAVMHAFWLFAPSLGVFADMARSVPSRF